MLGFSSAWLSKTDDMAEIRNTYKILAWKLPEKWSVETKTYVWVLKMTLTEIGVNSVDWIDLLQYKLT